ncbi:MAG TPA: protein kinase, partial [Coleofasciculaceae cyanobacterium]
MCYCINPSCRHRDIVDTPIECPSCHTTLRVKDRYLLVKPLRRLDIPHPYAEIFQVQDLKDNHTSKVLKILKNNGTKLVELFDQEASFLINLIHSGIPRAEEQFSLTLGNGQELHCLVMERIEGENLEQWLKPNKQISQAQALEWMRQLVTILDDVHQKRFFHRDIKPSNIMRKPDGKLVLIDFGTAREVTQTVINGQDVTVVYSDGYTAPEQIQGHAVPQ